MNEKTKAELKEQFALFHQAYDNFTDYLKNAKLFKYAEIDGAHDNLMETIIDFKEALSAIGVDVFEKSDADIIP